MLVGIAGLEPATFRPPDGRATQTAPYPVKFWPRKTGRGSGETKRTEKYTFMMKSVFLLWLSLIRGVVS